ncbi:MAG: Lrp/AsnC family transcriptional regulator [Flavobacteriales bacterium]|nr:Lrp/AsnC family transcriptional regulator [Flavobacteriales bacterium]
MDNIDKKILGALQRDARMTMKELANEVGISTTPVYERVKRLQGSGVLKFKAIVDRKKLGYSMIVFCQITLNSHEIDTINNFEERINSLPEIVESYHTAGSFDYLLKVIVRDMDHYQSFLVEKLSSTRIMANIQSVFVMSEKKYSLDVPFDEK